MAKVIKVKNGFAVAHDTTGAVIKRKGKRVVHPTKAEAQEDARATRSRIRGKQPRRSMGITPKRPKLSR